MNLLAIILAFSEWRHYLMVIIFTLDTDHMSLKYLDTQPKLSSRQTRWMEFLSQFEYKIVVKAGKDNVVADALSRRPDHDDSNNNDSSDSNNNTNTTVAAAAVSSTSSIVVTALVKQIKAAYKNDSECVSMLSW